MNKANAYDVRVRPNGNDFQRGSFSIIFGLFHARAAIRRFYSLTNEAKFQRLVHVATMIANWLVSSFVVNGTCITVLALERPTTNAALRRQDGPAAILGRGRLFFLFRDLFRVLCRG